MSKSRFRKRDKKQPLDLDITSLLDILVILLVFLLKSYNPSDLKLDLVEKVDLAQSFSKQFGSRVTTIQLNRELDVYVDHQMIANLSNTTKSAIMQELAKKMENEKNLRVDEKNDQKKKTFPINFVFDQKTAYREVKKLMQYATEVGFTDFKLIVKGQS